MTSLGAILSGPRTARQSLWGPLLCEREIVCLYGAAGVGKTNFVLSLVHALLSPHPFLRWNCPKPRRIKYLDPEMGRDRFGERLQKIVDYYQSELPDDCLDVSFPEDFGERAYPNIYTDEGKRYIWQECQGRDLLILDGWLNIDRPLSRFDDDDVRWQKNFPFLKRLTRYGTTVLIIHHANKSGSYMGTSQLRNGVDCMLELTALPRQDEAMRCALRVDKARHFGHPDTESLALTHHVSGMWEWELMSEHQASKITDLELKGLKAKGIAEALGLTLSEVQQVLSRTRKPTTYATEDIF